MKCVSEGRRVINGRKRKNDCETVKGNVKSGNALNKFMQDSTVMILRTKKRRK